MKELVDKDVLKAIITIFYLYKEVEEILNMLEILKIYKRHKLIDKKMPEMRH